MLANRTSGRLSLFDIPLQDEGGSTIDATAVRWSLCDEMAQELAAGTIDGFQAGDANVAFSLTADQLTLPSGVANQGREIVLVLDTADGEIELRDYFLLVDGRPLKVMVNTFMAYPEILSVRTL